MNALAQQLCERIKHGDPLSFAEFMTAALYHPSLGYYTRNFGQIGKRGDFFTSVSVGSFFGELLAFQFTRWMQTMLPDASPWQIVEAGAHDGQLARDILEAMESHGKASFKTLEYWIVENSPARRAAQEKTLSRFQQVRWRKDFREIKDCVNGVIFSNELLDAMPVHPFVWNAQKRQWEEMGVTTEDDLFSWSRLPQPTTAPPKLPEALLDVLPDGYIVELSPQAAAWWTHAASALRKGRLMTIDYGGTLEELISPSRASGTLRAYSRHRVTANVLADPGEQDITAHISFFEIQRAGELAGLKTEAFTTQEQFLTEVARELWTQRRSWPQNQVRQFQTLTHLEHLGRAFRVLIQSR